MSLVENVIKRMRKAAQDGASAVEPRRHEPAAPPRAACARVILLDHPALRAAGVLPPVAQDSRITRQFRQIKRPLLANAIGRGAQRIENGQLIVVTSALPGEGKTFMSFNLALSLAIERDLKIVLVDADIPKPQLTRLFGLQTEPGLLDALRDSSLEVESLILATDVAGLSVLPAGVFSSDSTELLASGRMEVMSRALCKRDPRRLVLFDSPPVLLTSESSALAQAAGQVLFVVRAGVTSQSDVLSALSHVGERPCVSLVLNQSFATPSAHYYSYGQESDESGQEMPG